MVMLNVLNRLFACIAFKTANVTTQVSLATLQARGLDNRDEARHYSERIT